MFEAISGLKINLFKSEIIPVGGVTNVESLARELGCWIGALPTTYLGLPLRAPHNLVSMWDVIEERFRKRLSLWKRQFLSKGGRLTLLRNTLSSLLVYLMSLFRLLRKVKLRLERIQRDFLWGGGSLEKKPHLVKWSTMCFDKKQGGLGVRCFFKLDSAHLSKWLWRFANERYSL